MESNHRTRTKNNRIRCNEMEICRRNERTYSASSSGHMSGDTSGFFASGNPALSKPSPWSLPRSSPGTGTLLGVCSLLATPGPMTPAMMLVMPTMESSSVLGRRQDVKSSGIKWGETTSNLSGGEIVPRSTSLSLYFPWVFQPMKQVTC